MKKAFPLLLVMAFLLTACSFGGFNIRKDFFAANDAEAANEIFEKTIEAIQNQDSTALKALFSNNALKEAQNLDETIDELFEYFQGKMLSYNDWGAHGMEGELNDGHYRKELLSTYDVKTSQDEYRFAMEIISMDTADADNVGIRSLYVIRLEDDDDPQVAYRGDGKHTPGISINKTNTVAINAPVHFLRYEKNITQTEI